MAAYLTVMPSYETTIKLRKIYLAISPQFPYLIAQTVSRTSEHTRADLYP